jgi:hypothetical protein
MEDQHAVARAHRPIRIDTGQRMMPRTGDALTRVFIGFADVDQHGAVGHQFGGALRRNGLQLGHCSSPFPCITGCRCS